MTDKEAPARPSAAERKAHKVWWPIEKVRPYDKNPKKHPAAQIATIRASLREFGFGRPLIIGTACKLLVGHGTLQSAKLENYTHVPVVVRDDLSEAKQRGLALADNRTAELGKWDSDMLAEELQALGDLGVESFTPMGFTDAEVAELIAGLDGDGDGDDDSDNDALPTSPIKTVTQRGDIWQLGGHRLLCGDCTQAREVEKILKGRTVDLILTDPPYCSGGFQESQRGTGSIGVRSKTQKGRTVRPAIENDKLSTRGYLALMKAVLGLVKAPIIYAFTDWRMWTSLYDVAESSGFSVKNMLVWDKGTAGMGRGWRAQHELVLFGARKVVDFKPKNSRGNVLKARRTGNILHPTQKPVDLMEQLLEVTDMAATVYDPMSGSGTTLIACEMKGRTALCVELAPAFVDVAVRRWEEHTKHQAKLEGDGRTFSEIEKARA